MVNIVEKFKKLSKKKKIAIVLLFVLVAIFGFKSYKEKERSEEVLNVVKSGYFVTYDYYEDEYLENRKRTIGVAVDNFFSDVEWTQYNEDGVEFVQMKGICLYKNSDVVMVLKFKVNEDNTFRLVSTTMDGEKMDEDFQDMLIEECLEEENSIY